MLLFGIHLLRCMDHRVPPVQEVGLKVTCGICSISVETHLYINLLSGA